MICCFFGHRTINETELLKKQLYEIIENLIRDKNTDTFLFGSKSRFNDLCYETTTKLLTKYPHIKRVYVRAEYPDIDDSYEKYLLKKYEDTYYPERALGARRGVYIERNFDMIRKSQICVVYYNEDCLPTTRKSGTGIALSYAKRLKKQLIILS